jgi:hypothetical protein
MKNFILAFAGISILALAGCISQEQADTQMAKGCEGAVNAMLAPRSIKTVKGWTADDDTSEGSVHRRIFITYVENDDFAESEKKAECLFSQQWGPLKSTHAALLEQLVANNTILGKKNGVIQGSMEDFIKLTNGASAAMGQ